MSIFIDNAISGWIRNAEKTGELKNNAFKGKALDLEDYFNTPAEHRMGMKILRDANCVPPAVEIMQQIEAKKIELDTCTEPSLQEQLGKELRTLQLKRNLLIENQ